MAFPPTNRPRRAVIPLLCGLLLAGHGLGQRPSAWASLHVPSGVALPALSQLGKLVSYRDGADLWVFSAFTRRWHRTTVGPTASVRQSNDVLLVEEGGVFTAFSSLRGTFETVTLSPGAQTLNPPQNRNDSIFLVLDGTDLWAFSAFTGRWLRHSVSSSIQVGVGRQVAVVVDGGRLLGMGAMDGTWVARPSGGSGRILWAEGTVAVVEAGGMLHGFAAQPAAWDSAPEPPAGAASAFDHDVAVWSDAVSVLGFSGLVGRFDLAVTATPTALLAEQQVAVAVDSGRSWLFSAPRGRWTAFSASGSSGLALSAGTALLVESEAVHAYSTVLGRVTTLPVSASSWDVNWSVAVATDAATGTVHCYSALTGRWVPVPDATGIPRTAFNGVLLQTRTGWTAFSARDGRLAPLAAAATAVQHVDGNSGVIALEEPDRLHAFEARRGAWVSAAKATTAALNVSIWRTTLVATEPGRAWGFGTLHGEIEGIDLPEPDLGQRASSESGRVETATHVLAFGSVSDLLGSPQWPEFRRMFGLGSPLDLHLRGPAGAGAAVVLARPARQPLQLSLGPLYLDPASPAPVAFPLGPIPPSGRARIDLFVPEVPQLVSTHVAFQGALLPAAGPAYLTRMYGLLLP